MNISCVVRNIDKYKSNKYINFISIKNIKKEINKFDYLIIACPLNNETKNLINFNLMKNMNKNSVVINIARGPIINEADLYKVLKNKIIRAAVIDVWYNYPKNNVTKIIPIKYPLHKLDNITFFHIHRPGVVNYGNVGLNLYVKIWKIYIIIKELKI